MVCAKLKEIAKELSQDEIAVILVLGDRPYEIEIIARDAELPTHIVEGILIKFERCGFIRKRWD